MNRAEIARALEALPRAVLLREYRGALRTLGLRSGNTAEAREIIAGLDLWTDDDLREGLAEFLETVNPPGFAEHLAADSLAS